MPAQPLHKFVTPLLNTHAGFPDPKMTIPSGFTRATNMMMMHSIAVPYILIPIICLETGYNHSRINIIYSQGNTTAYVTIEDWITADYAAGDYINIRAHGGVPSSADGYYKILNIYQGGWAMLIEVPSTFAVPTVPEPVTEDLLFPYTYFALQGNTSYTNDDCASKNGASPNYGGAAPTMTTDSPRFGTQSIRLHAATGACAIRFSTSMTMSAVGGVEFAVDGWWKVTETGTGSRYMCGWSAYNSTTAVTEGLRVDLATGLVGWYEQNTLRATTNTAMVTGTWHHIAVTRTAGVIRLFVDGVLQTATYTTSYFETDNRTFVIGTILSSGSTAFPGNVATLRITLGHPRWTETFMIGEVNYVPKNRPGVGLFACRGGNILTRPTNPLGAYPSPLTTPGVLTRAGYSAYLASYQAAFPDSTLKTTFRIGSTTISGASNDFISTVNITADLPILFTNSLTTGQIVFGATDDAVNAVYPADFTFVISNAGFYYLVRRRDAIASPMRATAGYFGKTQQLVRNDTGLSDAEIADREVVAFTASSSHTTSGYTNVTVDNLILSQSASYNKHGLLATVTGQPTAVVPATSTTYMAIQKSQVASKLNSINQIPEPLLLMGNNNNNPVAALAPAAYSQKLRPTLYRLVAAFAPDNLCCPPGSRWDALPSHSTDAPYPNLPVSIATVTIEGVQKKVVLVYSPNTMGAISLDVADWE